ncbi:MAG: Na/Pi cotransporter family protein [Acidibrevibacterium sp.]|uniref:Na/Pi cotransporter family protein n=1 Tax=Acidibrevibacterium fodinaquatile TaxID=1969806 RepID=UPI000E0D0459|nr:Na/Pi cotransporter family protein [Acidibrevibacterium fodinaquatile]MCA7120757.1 Na/Pi cotransporter family protein [Acidibrevibacterium fodinaquatile]
MDATLTLVDLAGLIALLLWGVHMVQTGVQRAFGPSLRRFLGVALARRPAAFVAGLGITAILQSSTATGLMVASFAAEGMLALVPGLAVMLGANVGTTLIVQVLSFDVSRIATLFILAGVIAFRRGGASQVRDLGRVGIGLGLMLLALHLLLQVITPYEDVPSLRLLLGALTTQPLMDVLLAALLTWAAHSSVAVVLVIMSFAARGVVPPDAAFALVLGANLGTAINPLLEGSAGDDPAARRLPMGNLLNRVAGVIVALLLLGPIGRTLVVLEPDPARAVADFHTAFNLVLALIFFPALTPYARLLAWLLPSRVAAIDPGRPLYLDAAARETPTIAIAAAAREALRMADVLETMLAGARAALIGGDRRRVGETRRLDDVLDRLNAAIKAYLTLLDPESMSEADHQRLAQVLAFTTHLENAGDVVDKNLLAHAAKRIKRGIAFSPEGGAELDQMFARLVKNLRTAASVFLSGDLATARLLAAEKETLRDLEARATAAHFARLRAGRIDSTETSTLHLDVLRDLLRINTHFVAAAAYPVLEEQGALLPSRLRPNDETALKEAAGDSQEIRQIDQPSQG